MDLISVKLKLLLAPTYLRCLHIHTLIEMGPKLGILGSRGNLSAGCNKF